MHKLYNARGDGALAYVRGVEELPLGDFVAQHNAVDALDVLLVGGAATWNHVLKSVAAHDLGDNRHNQVGYSLTDFSSLQVLNLQNVVRQRLRHSDTSAEGT